MASTVGIHVDDDGGCQPSNGGILLGIKKKTRAIPPLEPRKDEEQSETASNVV
jgi:hypothetical protein